MQLLSTYNDNLGTAVLLLGPPGGGKTVLGCRLFPKTYVLVADMNFASGVRYLAKINETENVVGFDTVAIDETGKKLGPQEWYPRMFKLLDIATKDPNIGAIFIDSATFVADYIIAKIAMCSDPANIRMPAGKESFDKWAQYLATWRGLILELRASGKKIIMSAHETKDKDESDSIFKYTIALSGQIAQKLPNMFSDVWRCEVEESGQTVKYKVRLLGNIRHELKNNFGWTEVSLDSDEVVKRVRATLKPQTK
jgi:hypothetical protein